MNCRRIFFWAHLAAGVVCGAIIALMSLTGSALAFEKELVAWSERDARRILAPEPGTPRLPVDTLLARARERQPSGSPSSLVVAADPTVATLISYGRTNLCYVNPFTGVIRDPASSRMRQFMQIMLNWHRWLGREGEQRETARAITGACNLAFLGLGLSGLYLWWPRHWTFRQLRAVTVPSMKGHGKARDWNWHNAFGFWAAPVLIVLTATALPISYRWAGDLIYSLTGTPKPAGGTGSGPTAAPAVELTKPAPGAQPLDFETLLAGVREQVPHWELMTLRFAAAAARGSRESSNNARSGAGSATAGQTRDPALGEGKRDGFPAAKEASRTAMAGPVTLSVKEIGASPRFASWQFTLDPFTGAILRKEHYTSLDPARQVRSWTRFLHTGEALGPVGQAVAGLASLVAGILVWTGLALTWRRFFGRKNAVASPVVRDAEVLA